MNKEKVKPLLLKIFEILSMVFITIYPPLYMYFNNVGEATFMDALPITLVFIGLTALFFGIFYVILKDITKAVFSTNILVFLSLNFKKIEDLLIPLNEHIFYWHIVLLVLFLVVNIVIILKQFNFKEAKNINILVCIVYFVLLSLSFINAVPDFIKYNFKSSNVAGIEDNINLVKKNNIQDKPNFYYFIFDEYAGYENAKYFFDYEDELYNYISDLKVNVSKTSYNKDWLTARVLPDLFNLEYVTFSDVTEKDVAVYLKNPTLYQICRSSGYKLNILSTWNVLGKENVNYTVSFNNIVTAVDQSFKGLLLTNTIYYPILSFGENDQVAKHVFELLNEFKTAYRHGKEGMCTIGHIALPHSPFLFQADGTLNKTSTYYQRNDQSYLNQLKFTAKKIDEILRSIIEKDPKAVILIQSDHGSRMKWYRFTRFKIGEEPTKEEYKIMTNHLNLLYYQGQYIDIEGKSGYQILNETVQHLFGYEGGYKNGYITSIDESYENRNKTSFR